MEAQTMAHEIRSGLPAEFRAEDAPRVSGYAAVFDEETNIGGMFRERIAPGAFRSAIGRDDVVFLVNHAGLPLARTRSGTLTLREDKRGLHIESELDGEDPDVRAIVPKMRRGDLDKMSFAFRATKQEWDESGDIPLRTIYEAELFDVSIVTEPAYGGTEIGLRARDAWLANRRAAAAVIATRMRMQARMRGI
jgi:HK97 family phage prohead protease